MKNFFKIFFASFLGSLTSIAIVSFLGICFIVGLIFASQNEDNASIEANSVYHLSLVGDVVDRSSDDNYIETIFNEEAFPQIGLDDLLSAIGIAKTNDNIKGIYLDCGVFSCNISSARTIREALIDFKQSGKFIVAYGGSYTQGAYYIASVADDILLNPVGMVDVHGLSSTLFFYKEILDKLGIDVQLVKVGAYKSFAEQYTNTDISEENKEQTTQYLTSMWNSMTEDIAFCRGISINTLNALADSATALLPTELLVKEHLVDSLIYGTDAKDYVAKKMNITSKDLHLVKTSTLLNSYSPNKDGNKIAVVYAVGSIDGSLSDTQGNINSKKLARTLRKIREDDKISAVVLRINSPGGSAYGAEQIWNEVKLLNENKPVIVSMNDYAASGGYYIACPATKIVAEPTTLTGSIGIFGVIPNFKGTMEKIGISSHTISTNDKADMLSGTRPFNESERQAMQRYIDAGYELFVKRCAEGRHMTTNEVKAIAEGHVWTGKKARELGLVDELGSLNDAIALAAQEIGAKTYTTEDFPRKEDWITRMMKIMDGNILMQSIVKRLSPMDIVKKYETKVKQMDYAQMALPYNIYIH